MLALRDLAARLSLTFAEEPPVKAWLAARDAGVAPAAADDAEPEATEATDAAGGASGGTES